ncbi:MAG: PD40 domain-containing protein [Flavobacteriales bacterium]|nr:PD40 domain-containing protein [Flavobacteriales bacterium]
MRKREMKKLISFVVLTVLSVGCIAQEFGSGDFKKKFTKADALVYDGKYMDALPLLEDLYAYDTSNANLNYLLGMCYLIGKKDHDLAIRRLESATKSVSLEYSEGNWKEKNAPGKAYYFLGRAYHYKNRFDRAITNYYNYRSFIEMDDVETYNQVRQQIQYAENAKELIQNPINVKVTNLGPNINTKFPDYCPVVSADGRVLIFTSRREGGTGGAKDESGNYYDDIYVCDRQPNGQWSKPRSIGSNINTAGHEAAIGLSPDGQLLFIYKDDNNDGNIYQSKKTADGWSEPQPLGSDINTPAWETHATVTAAQDLLVFTSNRSEGGYGGRDLWYCKKLPNGEWGLAQNMGSVINTDFEEDSPFISADGNTLIFSSQGHTSMGGFDIFRSELVDGVWSNPKNIGYPISSSEDDVFLTLAPDGKTGFYSSNMDGGYGEADLYRLYLELQKSVGMAVARGVMKVPAMDYADIEARIEVTDAGGAMIGTYRPNQSTGYYVLILTPGETYNVSYLADGYPSVVRKLPVSGDESYQEYEGVIELDEVVFGEDILALQKQTEQLEREKAEAAARAAEEERLAQEAMAKAKEQAALRADSLLIASKHEEERRKAEELAAKEKETAALALKEEEEKAKQAEVERKKQEALAKYKAEQEAAAKLAEEFRLREEQVLAAKQAEEAKRVAEEEARIKAEQEAAAKAAEEARQKEEQELAAKQAEEAKRVAEEEARMQSEQEAAAKAAEAARLKEEQELAVKQTEEAQKVAEEEARMQAEQEAAAKAAEAARQKEEQELAVKQAKEAQKVAEEEARMQAEQEAAAKAAEAARQKEEELAAKRAEEVSKALLEAQALAQAEQEQQMELKKQSIQARIEELKAKQQEHEQAAVEVKEVSVQKMEAVKQEIAVDAQAIDAKRQAMLSRIEQLKQRKSEVEKQKVVDEKAVTEASEKEKEALQEKQELEVKADKTKKEIADLEKELKHVEGQVAEAQDKVIMAREEVEKAEQKVAADIEEEKRILQEQQKKIDEAKAAEEELKELKELERQRLEQERLAADQREQEQREEAERTKRELIQLEALAEQQAQVQAALEIEERKKREIEAADNDAFSEQEILNNATTLDQLRKLNEQLIRDNLDLKKQLAVLNAKLDLLLQRMDYEPDIERVDIPTDGTLKNLQEGRRLILRNIFFDYNQATLRPNSKHELNRMYDFMKNNPSIKIEVSGHTDSRGNDEYNMRLSKDRAQAVVDYLVRNGISPSRLTAVGYGETRPIARNENSDLSDNPVGRQLNRRIEIRMPEGEVDGVEVEEINVPEGSKIP